MASAALDGSGQPHQDLEASVSSKLFNSGRPLGSFLDIGNTSDSSVRPPIDTDDGDSAALSRGVSAATIAKSVSSCSADARTPRAVQGVQKTNVEATTDIQYPPVLSSMSRSSLVPSTHPQLLPHQANLDPSSSGAVSYNSSGQSSFDNSNARQDRLAVSHPGILNSSSLDRAYPNAMNAGLKGRSELGEYGSSNGVNGDTPKNGSFDKISGGKQNMQIFGTPPVGIIGVHQPREIIRLDRDYSSGEICQFWSGFPLELEGRITATQHLKVMNELNAILASAFDPYRAIFDNVIAVLSLYLSTWLLSSHYDKEIVRFERALGEANRTVYNPVGLNLINPKKNGYLFLELEYY